MEQAADTSNGRSGTRRRWLKAAWASGGIVLLAVIGALVYQRAGEVGDEARFPAPGTHYDVGDVSLHMVCRGSGAVTVVLSSGMGNPAASWHPLERLLEAELTVCSYDRDGLGWSGDSGGPRDAVVASERLARLLDMAEIKGPVILVGHSYGGLIARVFVAAYPDRVGALVLLDSSHEDMMERFPPAFQEGFRDLLEGFRLAALLNRFGIPRALDLFLPAIDGLRGEDQARSLALLNSVSHMSGTGEEAAGWDNSAAAARVVRENGFGHLPLDVFVAGDWPDEMRPSWMAMQRELATLSTDSRYRVIADANHPEIAMDARFIEEVARAIRLRAVELGG